MSLENKKILLVIGGGISAYKSLDLIRLLQKKGCLGAEKNQTLGAGNKNFLRDQFSKCEKQKNTNLGDQIYFKA